MLMGFHNKNLYDAPCEMCQYWAINTTGNHPKVTSIPDLPQVQPADYSATTQIRLVFLCRIAFRHKALQTTP